MCQCLASIPVLQRQDLYLGQDNEKHTYYFFPQFNTTDVRVFKKYHRSRAKAKADDEYELIAWDIETLEKFVKRIQKIRKSKNSNLYELEQTVEALYDELSKRDDQFKKANERGRLAFIKDYLATQEEEEEEEEEQRGKEEGTIFN